MDLKPENILLQKGVPKIADFGASHCGDTVTSKPPGTSIYAAPEVITAGETRQFRLSLTLSASSTPVAGVWDPTATVSSCASTPMETGSTLESYAADKADVWSLGVTLFVLCTGRFPWRAAAATDPDYSLWVAFQSDATIILPVGAVRAWNRVFGKPMTRRGVPLSLQFMDLIWHMLDPNPSRRVNLRTVANDPWFAESPQ